MKVARLFQICLTLGYIGMTAHAAEDNPESNHLLNRTIVISNDHIDQSVRCQLVLAHFVTYDPVNIAPKDTLLIPVELRNSDRTIFYLYAGTYMAIEDLLCGFDSNWSLTRRELSLTPLQSLTVESLHFTCGFNQSFFCMESTLEP